MESKSYIKTFLISLMVIVLGHILIVEYTNSEKTSLLGIENSLSKHHVNLKYKKIEALKARSDYENLIIGSSTSEAFIPIDVTSVFGGKTISGSLGGATTAARLAVVKRALEDNKNLKNIIYVADFFEFNKFDPAPMVKFNRDYQKLLNYSPTFKRGFQYFKYYFSNQMLESSFNIFKRKKKNKYIKLNDDGTTFQSMILSPVQGKNDINSVYNDEEYKRLMVEVNENYVTYESRVLNDFKELHSDVLSYYKELQRIVNKSNATIYFVLSPYQKSFYDLLMKDEQRKLTYNKWLKFMVSLSTDRIKVFNPKNEFFATNLKSGLWRDGIHYNRTAAFHIIKQLK